MFFGRRGGDRNAFLPHGDPHREDAAVGDGAEDAHQSASPPVPVVTAAQRPKVDSDGGGSIATSTNSPPSVVSSSDSSHGTCQSTLSSPNDPLVHGGTATGTTGTGGIQSHWLDAGTGRGGVFDCIRVPSSAPRRVSSTGSFAMLFGTCMRAGEDEEENEYYNEDEREETAYRRRACSGVSQGEGSLSSHCSYVPRNKTLDEYFPSSREEYTDEELNMADGDDPTHASDLNRVRNYHVVTTAALPWFTGTAVNPLLRSAYLLRRNNELKAQMAADVEGQIDCSAAEIDEFAPEVTAETMELSPFPSNGSLEYSCFSLSEIVTPTPTVQRLGRAECFSPMDEDSLLISPITPANNPMLSLGSDANDGQVTLVVPWLQDDDDRRVLYGKSGDQTVPFKDQEEQEAYIRNWLSTEADMAAEAEELNIIFYPAKFHNKYNSIFALGDICELIDDRTSDVCILEEPEHLNWYNKPKGTSPWTSKFGHCVGVIHTNYKAYALNHGRAGVLTAPILAGVNRLVVANNCHRVVKLSGVLQEFGGSEIIENIHGIRKAYLDEGRRRRLRQGARGGRAYFIGKLLWAKGFDQLIELQSSFLDRTGEYFDIDIYGSGPDEDQIKEAFLSSRDPTKWRLSPREAIPANFMGRIDHAALAGDEYDIFVNPSVTEVLCTTTAEATAMGKWVLIPSHPSNSYFQRFDNCLLYRNRREFVSKLKHAKANPPPVLAEEVAEELSWNAATARCVRASAISKREAAREERLRQSRMETSLTKTLSGFFSQEPSKDIRRIKSAFACSTNSHYGGAEQPLYL